METDEEYSDYDYDSDYSELSAQQHWEESMQQLTGLINWIVLPLIGKILGRRFSKIIWSRIAAGWYA